MIWLGDLNYRIALSYSEAKKLVEANDWGSLFEKDQVTDQMYCSLQSLIFENSPNSFNIWKNNFMDECLNQAHRMKECLKVPFLSWFNSLV